MCVCVCVCGWVWVDGCVCEWEGDMYISMELEEHKRFFLPHFEVRLSF